VKVTADVKGSFAPSSLSVTGDAGVSVNGGTPVPAA
jgi:hypothetical protein